MTGNDGVNLHEGDERMDPRDFMPVTSNEFGRICEMVIDGDTLERQITGHFMLMLQGFKSCEPSYLQTSYNQVDQKFSTEAILDTLDSIQSRAHGARNHERSLWTNLKEMLDARAMLASDQELLANSIERFCTLSAVEQVDLHKSGNDSVDCYNDLLHHLGVKRRVPLIGDNLCDSNG